MSATTTTTTTTSTTSVPMSPVSPCTSSSFDASLKRKLSTDESSCSSPPEPNHDVIKVGSHIDFQLADEPIRVGIVLGRRTNYLSLKRTIKPKCAKFFPRYVYTIFYKAKDQYRILDVFSTSIIGLYSNSSSSSSLSSPVSYTFGLYIGNVIIRNGIPLGTICSLGDYKADVETNVNYITHDTRQFGSFAVVFTSDDTSKSTISWRDIHSGEHVKSAITLEKEWKIEEGIVVANQNGSGLCVVVGIDNDHEKKIKVVKIIRKKDTLVFDNHVHVGSVQSDDDEDDIDNDNDRMIKRVDVTDVDSNYEADFLEQFCPVDKTSFAAACFR